MCNNPESSASMPSCLPEDFFDSNKKDKKTQEDELSKELELFEKEVAALQAESDQNLKVEFEKIQADKDQEERDRQALLWKKMAELEGKAEEMRRKTMGASQMTNDNKSLMPTESDTISEDLSDIDEFEARSSDWRSKGFVI